MLAHELTAAIAADRERDLRHRMRQRGFQPRPNAHGRLRDRLASILRPRTVLPPGRSARRSGRGLGSAVTGLSGRAGGTHGQGAC
jgi:hypothetical protein